MSTGTVKQEEQRKPPAVFNRIATFLLQTPLHTLFSKRLMLLTFTGRKSGKTFTIPVAYLREGETIYCFTDHPWWRNLLSHPDVTLLIQGKRVHGEAEVIRDETEKIANMLTKHIQAVPMQAKAFGIVLDAQKRPDREDVLRVAQRVVLICIHTGK